MTIRATRGIEWLADPDETAFMSIFRGLHCLLEDQGLTIDEKITMMSFMKQILENQKEGTDGK